MVSVPCADNSELKKICQVIHRLLNIALYSVMKFRSQLIPSLIDYEWRFHTLPEPILFAFASIKVNGMGKRFRLMMIHKFFGGLMNNGNRIQTCIHWLKTSCRTKICGSKIWPALMDWFTYLVSFGDWTWRPSEGVRPLTLIEHVLIYRRQRNWLVSISRPTCSFSIFDRNHW